MHYKKPILVLTTLLFATLCQAQVKAIAAPGNMQKIAKKTFPVATNIPVTDTVNIYNKLFNDDTDDLMENHPAEDIYNEIWTANSINPYKVSVRQLPDSITIDCSDFVMPVDLSVGRVTSHFGPRRRRYHHGIDIGIPVGNDVRSAFAGKVRMIKYNRGGYGRYIVVRHDNGLETVYAHLSAATCEVNQRVEAGEVIGKSGNTGRSTGPHLHFETRYVGNAFNPTTLINFKEGIAYAESQTLTKKKSFGHMQHKARTRTLAKYYKVRRGDNLGKIALRNRTTVSKLKRINGLKSTKIRAGQRLRIR